MRHVKWIFVVLLISFLTSFVNKDKPNRGLNVGDTAPDFSLRTLSPDKHEQSLSGLKGKRVVLSFWASYDAPSRLSNAALNNTLRTTGPDNVEMVSISFDEYESIFRETVRKDQIATQACFVETEGESSPLYEEYQLEKGFTNYLLDENGIILAKDLSADELTAYLSSAPAQNE